MGQETPELYYQRLQLALVAHRFKSWPYAGKIAIKESSQENDKTQYHVFAHWTYLGATEDAQTLADLSNNLSSNNFSNHGGSLKFDHDIYKLLMKALNQPKTHILQLSK